MKDHQFQRTRRVALLIALCAIPALGTAQKQPKAAEAWPSRPVKILVGFPGGSSPDLVARAIAEPLAHALGQPVVVENRPGAAGNIAADLVAKATDNHMIGVMINGNLTIARLLNPKTPYDPATDLAPISLIGTHRWYWQFRPVHPVPMRGHLCRRHAKRAISGAMAHRAWARWGTSAWSC